LSSAFCKMEPLTASQGSEPTYDTFEGDGDENETVHEYGEVLNEIGCGPFQVFVYISLILSVISGLISFVCAQILPSILKCDDEWDADILKYLPLLAGMGALVGSVISGIIADIYGRKKSLILSNIVLAALMIGSAFVPNSQTLSKLVFFIGCGAGGSLLTPIVYIVEVFPCRLRGAAVFCIYGCGLVGNMISLGIGLAVASEGWKVWLGVNAIFPILASFCSICMPESPLFQLSERESAKNAIGTLQLAVRLNKRYLPIGRLLSREAEKRGNPISAFQSKMIKTTLLLLVITFLQGFIFSGVADTTFSLKSNAGNCENTTLVDEIKCQPIEKDTFVKVIIDISIYFAVIVIGIPLNELIGRKFTLLSLSAVSALFSFLLLICMSIMATHALSYINMIINLAIMLSIFLLTAEVYDSEKRAVMLAMIFSIHILANSVGSVAFSYLIPFYFKGAPITLGVLSVIAAMVTLFFPTETKSKPIE